jgi:predicted nucleotidyltransferase
MRQLLRANSAAIRRVVEGYHARNPRVFGSVAHGDDNTDSDIDILVEPSQRVLEIAFSWMPCRFRFQENVMAMPDLG